MVKCGHPYCSDCRTKRGRNQGNRNQRHNIKTVLRNRTKTNN